jgi:hypothetical protein
MPVVQRANVAIYPKSRPRHLRGNRKGEIAALA